MMKIINTVSWVGAVAIAASLAVVMPAFAQTLPGVSVQGGVGIHDGANGGAWHGGMPANSGIFGTVSAVSGTTITVTSHPRMMHPMAGQAPTSTSSTAGVSTVYTVDASNAQIYKDNATSTVSISDVAVGDTVVVQGAVSGTNVTATVIHDDFAMPGGPMMPVGGRKFGRGMSTSTPSGTGTPIIQGNGEPVIGGAVTAISGTTVTVTNTSNVTYTIDAASTTIEKNGTSTAIGSIAVGDELIVQGTVNGNSVTASSIIDQGVKAANASSSAKIGGFTGVGVRIGGFFGAIGGFFQHFFGF